eukprot:scaffold1748_cov258-Pinguiococcus_pyrenoidosus.AAC.7
MAHVIARFISLGFPERRDGVRGCQLHAHVLVVPHLRFREVEERWQVAPVRQRGVRIPQLVEEGVRAGPQGRQAPQRVVRKHRAHEADGLGRRTRAEHLRPRMCLDLRELELAIVRVHRPDLLLGRRAQHLDDLHELIYARLPREDRLAQKQLPCDAARGPHVDGRRVVRRAEDELRRAVVATTDVTNVRLAGHEDLRGAEVAELQNVRRWV